MSLTNLTDFLKGPALTVALLLGGIFLLSRSHKADHHRAITSVGVVLLGLLVVGLALTGRAGDLGTRLVNLVLS